MINPHPNPPRRRGNELKNSIFKILIELFIFDKVKRSKIKARWAKRYLEKYIEVQADGQLPPDQYHCCTAVEARFEVDPVLQDKPVDKQLSTDQIDLPLPLWQYWHQGKENAPELIQRCFESVQKYEGDRKINILSFDTIKDYVELPQRYYDLVSSGKMPVALFSDILRMYLLTQYGGVWIDSTILLTDKIPQEIIDSSFCVVRKDPEKDNQENKMSCYFIRADKNSPNLNAIKRTLENYWAENDFMINYFMFEHISTMLSDKTPELKAEWDKMPYLDGEICGKLQTIMDKNFSQEEFNELKSETFMHKLTYKKQPSKEFLDNMSV